MNTKIRARFEELKRENSSYELKEINGHYYVYLSKMIPDSETGKYRKKSVYIGKITDAGELVLQKDYADKVNAVNEIAGNEIAQEERQKSDSAILMALSMNGRISMEHLGKLLGISTNAAAGRVRSVEKRYGVKYLLEIDLSKLGFSEFFVTMKFKGEMPTASELKKILSKYKNIQLAALAKGTFDVLAYILVENAEGLLTLIRDIGIDLGENYEVTFNSYNLSTTYGFIPIRDEFIDLLKGKLLNREYLLLKELNNNGGIDLSDIDKKYGFDIGRSSYTFYKMKNAGIIKRITITLQKPHVNYIGLILLNYINLSKFQSLKPELLKSFIEYTAQQINKYTYIADDISYDTFLFIPSTEGNELNYETERIKKQFQGVLEVTQSIIIYDFLIGNFCYRRFDNAFSIQQQVLEESYSIPKANRTNYEREKHKKERMKYDIRGAKIGDLVE